MDPFDDDAEPSWSPGAPPPPEHRAWRHPSELASTNSPRPAAAQSSHRRHDGVLAVGAGLVGAVTAGALLVLLLPSAGDPPTLVSPLTTASAQVDVVVSVVGPPPESASDPSTQPSLPVTSSTQLAVVPQSTAVTTTTTIPVTEPTLAGTPDDAPDAASDGLPRLAKSGATAVPVFEGEYLLTTAVAVGIDETTVDVIWGSAPRLLATVVARGDGFTLLQLDRQVEMTPAWFIADQAPTPGTWVTVLSSGRRRGVVVERDGSLALAGLAEGDSDLEGAPVLDATGRLLGLCTQHRGTTQLVAVTDVSTVLGARPLQAWLGIGATTSVSEQDQPSVLVTDIVPGGPAAVAGVLVGDVIAAIGTEPLETVVQLARVMEGLRSGDVVTIDVVRDGVTLNLSVALSARPFSL